MTSKNKALYEQIMISVSREVKKALALNEARIGKHQFSNRDLEEIKQYILEDSDFYDVFCNYADFDRYDSYDDAVEDLMDFLSNDVYGDCKPSEAHQFYILDEPDGGTCWMELKSGKLANLDNIYAEFKSIVR